MPRESARPWVLRCVQRAWRKVRVFLANWAKLLQPWEARAAGFGPAGRQLADTTAWVLDHAQVTSRAWCLEVAFPPLPTLQARPIGKI